MNMPVYDGPICTRVFARLGECNHVLLGGNGASVVIVVVDSVHHST